MIPGDGGAVSHVATMQPPKPEPVPPKEPDLTPPPPKPPDPPSAPEVSPKVSPPPSPLLTRKADPSALIADLALGGASLTAEPVAAQPIALTAQPSPTPTTPGGQRCDILQGLKANLQSSDQVQAALGRIPTHARSVANAILLWDGEWIDPLSVGGVAAIDPIEQAVALTVRSAPADCQTELMRGPRLIIIGDARNAMVLAFGSGEWRWTDLVATLPPNPG